jgi:hypothetical protein
MMPFNSTFSLPAQPFFLFEQTADVAKTLSDIDRVFC